MLKKSLHISVIFLLLLATTGVSITRHYCHGSLISTSLFGKDKSCCDSSCGSCHNETSFNKLNDDFVYSHSYLLQVAQSDVFKIIDCFIPTSDTYSGNSFTYTFVNLKAPPPRLHSLLPEYLEIFRC